MSLRALSAACLKRNTNYRPYVGGITQRAFASATQKRQRDGWLFIDSIFPVRFGYWDLRHYIGIFREETLLSRIGTLLTPVKTHDFEILALEPHHKDGGVFIKFGYTPEWSTPVEAISIREAKAAKAAAENLSDAAKLGDAAALEDAAEAHAAAKQKASTAAQATERSEEEIDARALKTLERDLRAQVRKQGGFPSWLGIVGRGDVWMVKGRPWREDMNRFASPYVKFAFEGPDVNEEVLYDTLRPYGRIRDLTAPVPVVAGALRSSIVTFKHTRSATIARNVIHGIDIDPRGRKSDGKTEGPTPKSRLRTAYEQPIQAHAIRDWLSSHPKIVLPIMVFLLGSLTYTIFDPIRALMVKGNLLGWLDYHEFTIYKWVRTHALDRFDGAANTTYTPQELWKDRQEAEAMIQNYLSDLPSTIAFISGPQGSGKSRMLRALMGDTERATIVIDCQELEKASTDIGIVGGLAQQTGYWPVFTFLNSMNSLIDLASVGLIGQKAGLSSSLDEQLHQILDVVATGLKGVSSAHRTAIQRKIHREHIKELKDAEEELRRERVRRGTYHDGRLDVVAGNGIMSELGIGDEMLDSDWSETAQMTAESLGEEQIAEKKREFEEDNKRKQRSAEDIQAVESLPIVVIRNFASKGGSGQEELLKALAEWSAGLAENQIAHVLVLSDNRENSKKLAKALPSKPLHSIVLYDADSKSALSFVKQKLQDAGVNLDYTPTQISAVEQLGGRASDLDSLIHKVRSGQQVEEAVEDLIHRGVSELRKNAFGDDAEDAKNLAWTREQAWTILKQLSKKNEISYYDVLVDFPFKGDEAALRGMEHSELITIGTQNGRPSVIKPGKPIFKYVFERLVKDPVFEATQEIALNDKLIAASESTIKACELELLTLKEIGLESSHWWGGSSASSSRAAFLFEKMKAAEAKVEAADKKTTELKKMLKKGI